MEPPDLPKRKKTSKEEDKDLISELPYSVHHHILSFLDLNQAVQTSVLSTKWRYIWASLPYLYFNSNLFESHKMGKSKAFREFVDQVLFLRDSNSNIESFRLDCYGLDNYDDLYCHRINTWMLVALRRNVQELYLNIRVVDREFQFRQCLFTCKSLVKLELKAVSRSIKLSSMSLPNLKTMLLHLVIIEGNDIQPNKIFSSCPVLESLTMTRSGFCDQSNLIFTTPNLKYLVIEHLYYYGNDKKGRNIELDAPNLVSLYIEDFLSNCYSSKNLPALVKAEIDLEFQFLDNEKVKLLVEFYGALHNVETLKLSTKFFELIATGFVLAKQTCFRNLRYLKLGSLLSRSSIHAITCLLENSPNIESFHLELTRRTVASSNEDPFYQYYNEVNLTDRAKVKSWLKSESWYKDMLYYSQLKFVEIRGIVGRFNEILFLEILLSHAKILEELTLFIYLIDSNLGERRTKFTEELRTLPRASSCVSILFI